MKLTVYGCAITAYEIGCEAIQYALCMDWCCQYGPNHLFKVGFWWIRFEVDYMNKNLIITKKILKCP